MIDIETKRKKWDKTIKVIVVMLVGLIFGPFAIMAIGGLAGLAVAWVMSEAIICFTPWMSMKFANWRVAALKHEASKNPIETLENQLLNKAEALTRHKEHIKNLIAAAENMKSEIQTYEEQFPGKQSRFRPDYVKMARLVQHRGKVYQKVKAELVKFEEFVDQQKAEWRVYLAAAAANKEANVGESFMDKLVADEAYNAIQTKLNAEFAELDVAMLDSNVVEVVATPANPPTALPEPGLDSLDLNFSLEELPVKEGVSR